MVNLPPPPLQLHCSEAEALGTGVISVKLSAILAAHFRTVRKNGEALLSDKRSGQGIHSFLAQITPGGNLIPGLDLVTLVGVDPDLMVHLLH